MAAVPDYRPVGSLGYVGSIQERASAGIEAVEAALTPRLRGRLHQLAFLVAIPAGLFLVVVARPGVARAAAIIYAVALAGLYGISSSYHRFAKSPRARYWMQRLDHSMIYVFIAASYTPFGLLVLKGPWAIIILATIWGGAAIGVLLKMLSLERTSKIGFVMYLALGWATVAALPQMIRGLSPADLVLLFAGGLLYTGGAIILACRRPDPVPSVFGYHEVWHTMVVGAASCHYLIIHSVVVGAH
jgi:hemolysin III